MSLKEYRPVTVVTGSDIYQQDAETRMFSAHTAGTPATSQSYAGGNLRLSQQMRPRGPAIGRGRRKYPESPDLQQALRLRQLQYLPLRQVVRILVKL